MEAGGDEGSTTTGVVDELPWLHAHELIPWGAHVEKELEHGHHQQQHPAFGVSGAKAALVNDSTVVVVGGRRYPIDHLLASSRVDLFDLGTEKWVSQYDIKGELSHRIGHSLVRVGDCAVVFGGESIDEPMHPAKCRATPASLGDCCEISYAQTVLRLTPITPSGPTEPAPSARAWHGAARVVVNPTGTAAAGGGAKPCDGMVVMGGINGGAYLADTWVLVFGTQQRATPEGPDEDDWRWTQLSTTGNSPLPLAYHAVVPVENGHEVLVVGGRQSPKGPTLAGVFVLDTATNAWSQVAIQGLGPDVFARCCVTAVSMQLPIDASTGRLRRIFHAPNQEREEEGAAADDEHEDGGKRESASGTRILVFGGFSEAHAALGPTKLLLLQRGDSNSSGSMVRELVAANIGLRSYLNHATVTTADGRSLYVFGGQDAMTHAPVDATMAVHFWRPQPGSGDDEDPARTSTGAVRTKVYDNGDSYSGEMDAKGLLRQGQGRCAYHDGGSYDGEWREDQRWGHGAMTYGNGDVYAGEWVADRRHGYGILELASTSSPAMAHTERRFEGTWVDDERDGTGVAIYSDGSRLEGRWARGVLIGDGPGEPTSGGGGVRLEGYDDGHGPCTYRGQVRAGRPHGHGESRHHATGETYVGAWEDGRRNGQGLSTLADGTTYDGTWRNGRRNGPGVCREARSRAVYEGKWVGGVRCGRGRCVHANGDVYDGEWRDDACHGHGRYTFADGTFYEGQWREGAFCGDGALVLDAAAGANGSALDDGDA